MGPKAVKGAQIIINYLKKAGKPVVFYLLGACKAGGCHVELPTGKTRKDSSLEESIGLRDWKKPAAPPSFFDYRPFCATNARQNLSCDLFPQQYLC